MFRFFELRQRFEAPNSSNRWDNPLFHVNMTPSTKDAILEDLKKNLKAVSSTLVSSPAGNAVNMPPQPPEPSNSNDASAPKKSAFRRAPNKKRVEPTQSVPATVSDDAAVLETTESSPPSSSAVADLKSQKLTFSGTVREEVSQPASADSSSLTDGDDISIEACCDRIAQFIKTAVAPPPNPATMPTPHLKADMLYLLDKTSQDVVTTIIRHQSSAANSTDPLLFVEYDRALEIHQVVSMAELQRHRRQFIKMNSQIPPSNEADVGALFIDFLALQL